MVTVGRGALSMSFFAFIFMALLSLFIAIINDHRPRLFNHPWVRSIVKVLLFVVLFVAVMKWAAFHNLLSDLVIRRVTQQASPNLNMFVSFLAFSFSAIFALANTIVNDYFIGKDWLRSLLRVFVFCVLFTSLIWFPWFHHPLASTLEWLRIERQ